LTPTPTPFVPLCGDLDPSDPLVFQISKSQYDAYYAGGTWNISINYNQYEQYGGGPANGGGTSSESTSLTYSQAANGCEHNMSASMDNHVTYDQGGGPYVIDYNQPTSLTVTLGERNGNYYAKYVPWVNDHLNAGTDAGTGYGTPTATVDGNSIPCYVSWWPGWSGYSDYINVTTTNFVATFTP
jgi:hypothetical protein